MKTVYVASKVRHAPRWRALRAAGRVRVVSTWIDEAGPGQTEDFPDLWRRCVAEAAAADATVVYGEPGETLKGALVEVGAALAAGKPVYAVGDLDDNGTWRLHPLVVRVETVDDALALLAEPPCTTSATTPPTPS